MKRAGFVVGMLFGAAAGLFLAPRRGAETRRGLREFGVELAAFTAGPFQTLASEVIESLRRTRKEQARRGPCSPTL